MLFKSLSVVSGADFQSINPKALSFVRQFVRGEIAAGNHRDSAPA
jgi:hypothetical protein